jgi:hypothetical protein
MKSCTGKIVLIFVLLLVLAILFIPYKSVHIKYKLDPHSLTNYKLTSHQNGYMSLFKFIALKSKEKSVPRSSISSTGHDSYSLNKTVFLIELMIILVLAAVDYFLFCVILKKSSIPK